MSQLPLPEGWIQEFDPKQKHPFWVSNASLSSYRDLIGHLPLYSPGRYESQTATSNMGSPL
ncbi:hypothetical protein K503DRAFT_765003 [Rhizopogon vinicolor AM-OR11-026]|uniref:WW domain-containing protein n=1 Tax=Rhizopogon vinicolor AM-OR11-026 TaxID=1314800 RepID=A0A1B7NHK7_9AGAM|nr:hypothetical protein K503DRAFT_765003 [Rhizopogon vinicolor AM-OR11-026]